MQYRLGICAIGYNRPDCLLSLLDSLNLAYYDQEVLLFISIDHSKNTSVKKCADAFSWNHGEKKVIFQPENLGLRKHVLTCGGYIEKFNLDALVVLEDDITVTPYFYKYVISCLDKYKNDERIAGFSLYNFPISYVHGYPFHPVKSEYDIYFMNCAMSWGQVWTREKWNSFMKWYELNNEEFNLPYLPNNLNQWPKSSWLKYHTRYCIEQNKYFTFPYQSLVTNNNEVGTHAQEKDTRFQSIQMCLPITNWKIPAFEECVVKYDGFFEPKFLGSFLGLKEDELTVDLYQSKKIYSTRYILSTKSLPNKVIKSFDCAYKPIEANIIYNRTGDRIFLYDSDFSSEPPRASSFREMISYNYYEVLSRFSSRKGLFMVIKYYLTTLISRISNRINF